MLYTYSVRKQIIKGVLKYLDIWTEFCSVCECRAPSSVTMYRVSNTHAGRKDHTPKRNNATSSDFFSNIISNTLGFSFSFTKPFERITRISNRTRAIQVRVKCIQSRHEQYAFCIVPLCYTLQPLMENESLSSYYCAVHNIFAVFAVLSLQAPLKRNTYHRKYRISNNIR